MTNASPLSKYAHLEDWKLLEELGDDARKWAEAFCEIVRENKIDPLDVDFMTGWFANAIEHSSDTRTWRMAKVA